MEFFDHTYTFLFVFWFSHLYVPTKLSLSSTNKPRCLRAFSLLIIMLLKEVPP